MSVGRPPKYATPEEMQILIDQYFNTDAWVADGDKRVFMPTVSGLAYCLDMSTEALRNYEAKDEFLATIKKAKQRVEIALERRLHSTSPVGTIFNLKNNFGWKDSQERIVKGTIGVAELTDEELADIASGSR